MKSKRSVSVVKEPREVTWGLVLKQIQISSVLLVQVCAATNFTFWLGGYMNNHLNNDLHFSSDNFGSIVFGQNFIYILTSFLIPCICPNIPRRFMLTFSVFFLSLCALLIGPSEIL